MPRNKSVSFSEYVRRLTEDRVKDKLGEVTPEVIHEKMDKEGVQFKVTVPEAMRNYWQAQLDDYPKNDTAMRITFIANSDLTLVDGFDYDESDHVFTLASVEADGYAFDLPYGLEIRTAVEIEAMPASPRQHCKITSFHVDVYNLKVTEPNKLITDAECDKDQRAGRSKSSKTRLHDGEELVYLAFKELGNPTNAEVYSWIKSKVTDISDFGTVFDKFGFKDTVYKGIQFVVEDFNTQSPGGRSTMPCVMTYSTIKKGDYIDVPISAKTFQNWCTPKQRNEFKARMKKN